MAKKLEGKSIAILAANGVEQVELEKPMKALKDAGAQIQIVSLESGQIKGWQHDKWGDSFDVDTTVDQADASEYQALFIPGGVMSPDFLRKNDDAVQFVRDFFEAQKPVGSICHGPWMLAEANVVRGRKMTSYPSIKTDLKNAGANWVDREVVVDSGLVTSRNPDDLDAFSDKLVEEFCEGKHEGQKADKEQRSSSFQERDRPESRPSL